MTYGDRASLAVWSVLILVAVILLCPWPPIGKWFHVVMKYLKTGNAKGL